MQRLSTRIKRLERTTTPPPAKKVVLTETQRRIIDEVLERFPVLDDGPGPGPGVDVRAVREGRATLELPSHGR